MTQPVQNLDTPITGETTERRTFQQRTVGNTLVPVVGITMAPNSAYAVHVTSTGAGDAGGNASFETFISATTDAAGVVSSSATTQFGANDGLSVAAAVVGNSLSYLVAGGVGETVDWKHQIEVMVSP